METTNPTQMKVISTITIEICEDGSIYVPKYNVPILAAPSLIDALLHHARDLNTQFASLIVKETQGAPNA